MKHHTLKGLAINKIDKNTLGATIERLSPVFSHRVGLLNNFFTLPQTNEIPGIFCCAGQLSNVSFFTNHEMEYRVGGAGLCEDEALVATFGEAIERYNAGIYDKKDMIFGSFEEVCQSGYKAIDPSTFGLYSQRQYQSKEFGLEPFNKDSKVHWVQGVSLVSNEPMLIPAAFVYLPYRYGNDESCINHLTSTGLAFGFSKEEAIISGLHEIIERDSFSIAWLGKLKLPKVNFLDSGSKNIVQLLKAYGENINKYTIFDMTSDIGIPAFMGMAEYHDPHLPAAAFGAAANIDKDRALYKTLLETAQTSVFARELKKENQKTGLKTFEGIFNDEIKDFNDGVLYYSYHKNKQNLDFLFQNTNKTSFAEIPDYKNDSAKASLAFLVDRVSRCGFEPVYIDITSQDIKTIGAHVVRVVVPGLVFLPGAHKYRSLGNNRVFEVPLQLGFHKIRMDESQLNTYPHAFP